MLTFQKVPTNEMCWVITRCGMCCIITTYITRNVSTHLANFTITITTTTKQNKLVKCQTNSPRQLKLFLNIAFFAFVYNILKK